MKCRIPRDNNGGMNAMLKQAQKMQDDMAALQADLEQREYSASSGGGAVSVTVSGSYRVTSLKINPDIIDKDDAEMLEDLITVAVNEALDNIKTTSEREMGALTEGLNIPGIM